MADDLNPVSIAVGKVSVSTSNPFPVIAVNETIVLDVTTVTDGAGAGNYLVQNADDTVGELSYFAPVNYAADAEATDTYVITLSPGPAAYAAGQMFVFKANTANTGAATLKINALAAITIVKGVNTTLANNDILANMFCVVVFDGTNFVLMNPRAL